MQEERREKIRIEESLTVRHSPAKSLFISSSETKNISSGGLCFPALQRLEPEMALDLDIDLPGFKEPIKAEAKVIWLSEISDINHRYDVGVQFAKISSTDHSKILHYISSKFDNLNM